MTEVRLRSALAAILALGLLGSGAELLDVEARELVIEGRRIPLTPLEFSLMSYLHEREDSAVGRESLLRDVWGHKYDAGSNVVDVLVHRLRAKIDPDRTRLHTIRGVGYVLRAP
jgi:DNA-binding response OmpR family regulator